MRIPITIGVVIFSSVTWAQTVRTNVIVRDGHSRIVRNLEPADFVVRENGADAAVSNATPCDPKEKHFVSLLFDPLSGEPARLAREAAIELLNASGKANAWFGVFEAGQTMRVRQAFTADGKAVRKAVDLMAAGKAASGDGHDPDDAEAAALMRNVRRASASAAELRTRPSAAALMALIRGEAAQPGRKVIVYFSQGFPVDPKQEGFRVIVSSANRAGVAVYAVDASALAISRDEEVRRAAAMQNIVHFGEERSGKDDPGKGPPSSIYSQTAVTADRLDRRAMANAPTSALAVLTRSTSGFLMENGASFRPSMRRVAEELSGYYEVIYTPRDRNPDGSFRSTRIEVKREKAAVQGREGYFATPDLSGRPVLPYEIPLLAALERQESAGEFTHRAAVLYFRGEATNQPVVTIALEVPAKDLKFQQDDAAGVYRARVAVVGLVRAADGTVVDRVGGDTPILCPPGMLNDMRRRFVSLQKEVELPPGKYTLETAAQDRIGDRISTTRTAFTVASPAAGLGLSSVAVARAVTPSSGEDRDAGFHLADKSVQPALDGVVGRGATGTVYFKVYPQAAGAVELAVEVWQGDKRALHSTQKVKSEGAKPLAQVLALDMSRVPAGAYELRVVATQGSSRAEERTPLVVEGGEGKVAAGLTEDAEVAIAPVEEPKSMPPTAEQQKLLETARENALKYSERLPNFICTQSTRRMMDNAGNGNWHTIEEASDLLSFYDGQEHYSPLTVRAKTKDGEFPASVSSAGEFGSLLREIFAPSANARFAWIRREQVRGRNAQVFSYAVDASHSHYRVTYRGSQQKAPVFAAFRGVVAVDPDTATVLKLTLTTDPMGTDIPVRQISIALDYDEVGVADQIYLLPISATIDVRLHKKTIARNEVTFRSYQRFSTDSRITFQAK